MLSGSKAAQLSLDQVVNNLDLKHLEIVANLDHGQGDLDQVVNNLDLKHVEIVADLDHNVHSYNMI